MKKKEKKGRHHTDRGAFFQHFYFFRQSDRQTGVEAGDTGATEVTVTDVSETRAQPATSCLS